MLAVNVTGICTITKPSLLLLSEPMSQVQMSAVQTLLSAKFITHAGKNALLRPWILFSFCNESAVQYLKIDNIPIEILQ